MPPTPTRPRPRVHPGAKPGGLGLLSGCPTIGGGRIPVWENIVTPVGRRRPPQCTGECPPARIPEWRRRRRSKKPGADRRAVGGGGRAQVSGRLSTKVSWKPTAAALAPPVSISTPDQLPCSFQNATRIMFENARTVKF